MPGVYLVTEGEGARGVRADLKPSMGAQAVGRAGHCTGSSGGRDSSSGEHGAAARRVPSRPRVLSLARLLLLVFVTRQQSATALTPPTTLLRGLSPGTAEFANQAQTLVSERLLGPVQRAALGPWQSFEAQASEAKQWWDALESRITEPVSLLLGAVHQQQELAQHAASDLFLSAASASSTAVAATSSSLPSLINTILTDEKSVPIFLIINFLLVVFGVGQDLSLERIGSPYPAGSTTYSKSAAQTFFSSRPIFVLRRLLQLAQLTGSFQLKLLVDWKTGNLEKNEKERAVEALALATKCGPTTIKLAQALSLRLDLIPEAYALQLRQLQDAVPPFPSDKAFAILRRELNVANLDEVFSSISPAPVASASIGQVYKAKLKDGRVVAVKIQRPQILAEIALDLYLLRLLTPLQVRISNAINKLPTEQADIDVAIALVDEWGRGFVAEVDYLSEAENTRSFAVAMEKRGLNAAVTSPAVVDELTRSCVIVTEWVDGTRLDRDSSPDVPRLCAVAVNA